MQSSSQAMKQLEAPVAAKAGEKANRLALLPLLTFSPLGNPLSELTPVQCNLFFDYLMLSLDENIKYSLTTQEETVFLLTISNNISKNAGN